MKKDFCTAVSLLLISLFCFSMCSKGDDLIIDPPPTEGETEDEDSIYTWESERQAILESTDMVLIYGGGHHRDPYEWNQERISPYVTYVDESGEEHWFFDSFLFLEIMDSGDSGSGTMFATGYGLKSATQREWQRLADYYFQSYTGLGALNRSIEEAVQRIGEPDKKRQVVICIPEPIATANPSESGATSKYWGSLKNGQMLDFSKDADRIAACKWYIDYVREKFDEKQYKNLELAGFYWVAEHSAQSATILDDISEYLNSYKYSLNWIPYYGAQGYNYWKTYGFNYAYYQPNYFFNEATPLSQLENACKLAIQYDMDMELEFDANALAANKRGYRLENYMKVFKEFGIWENKRLAYYEGGGGLLWLKNSIDPEDQKLYHEFCHFVIERPLRKIK